MTPAHGDFVKVIEFASAETFAALTRAAASRGLAVARHAPVAAGIIARGRSRNGERRAR
ncbi:MAG TPA: hypothetical protein VM076_15975 [Gemmatimonadaceae bacterium]|nr:hypothetical protein [Gemmatimonadaceae bacterium]